MLAPRNILLVLQPVVGAVHERIIYLWQGHILVDAFTDRHFLEKIIVIQLAEKSMVLWNQKIIFMFKSDLT
jgi:hypothetical protein